ncbi:MAG: tetratricopeptide repeat protein [Acidobacteriota bacterium]|nr:MAG: tetratricopeptide repeat protein [Acidobacteriota bacterium]
MQNDVIRETTEMVRTLRSKNDPEQLAAALRKLAELRRHEGDEAKALDNYEEAVSLYRKSGNALRLAHTIRHLGDIHRRAGRFDKALACYEEALRICRRSKDVSTLDLANTVRALAVLSSDTGKNSKAEKLWKKARSLYEQAGVGAGAEECDKRLDALRKQHS